ncbi:MAG: HAMP domain-containing histidine kinase [Cyclobacteriaceae bacterium]
MKLIHKFLLVYLVISLLAFGIGGLVTFNIFTEEIETETNYELWRTVRYLDDLIEKGVDHEILAQRRIKIEKLPELKLEKDTAYFSDTLAFHRPSNAIIQQRRVDAYRTIRDTTYYITTYETLIEPEDAQSGATRSMIILFLVLVGSSLVASFFVSKLLLRPFNESLQSMNRFSLQKSDPIPPSDSTTKEFKNLNNFVHKMTAKAIKDYKNLKEFGENLSHEISTPLAVASGKLDLLLQENNLNEEHLSLVADAQLAIQKLSKIQKALSLLTKIDNSEFASLDKIDISKTLNEKMDDYTDLIALKHLDVSVKIEEHVSIKADPVLIDILLTNLIGNSIKHNMDGGSISIELDAKLLVVKNTGDEPDVSPENFFLRFKKANQSSESLGLGLAIVKKICDISDFEITYSYLDQEKTHQLEVVF